MGHLGKEGIVFIAKGFSSTYLKYFFVVCRHASAPKISRWKKSETELFRKLLDKWNGDLDLVSRELGTKTVKQCRTKYKKIMKNEMGATKTKNRVRVQSQPRTIKIENRKATAESSKKNKKNRSSRTSKKKVCEVMESSKTLKKKRSRTEEIQGLEGKKKLRSNKNKDYRKATGLGHVSSTKRSRKNEKQNCDITKSSQVSEKEQSM